MTNKASYESEKAERNQEVNERDKEREKDEKWKKWDIDLLFNEEISSFRLYSVRHLCNNTLVQFERTLITISFSNTISIIIS